MAAGTFLLDTHAFAWAAAEPERLGDAAREVIREPDSALLLSAGSVWEMATKVKTGKWPEAEPLVADLESLTRRLGIGILPIAAVHARRAGLLGWSHCDPFDRMLAAQALVEQCPLITRDESFVEVPGLAVLW